MVFINIFQKSFFFISKLAYIEKNKNYVNLGKITLFFLPFYVILRKIPSKTTTVFVKILIEILNLYNFLVIFE